MALKIKIKQEIQEYFGKRGKIKKHTPGIFDDLKNPNKLGLFFCIKTKEELGQVRSLLNHITPSYNKISAFIFNAAYEPIDVITNKSITLFNLNDFTLFGKKKNELQQYIDEERLELMISFVFEPEPFCKKLISEINADFKIGPEHDDMNELYDMTIACTQDGLEFIDFFDQTEHYISALNIKSQ